jgi:hypothetical protein
MNNKIVIGTVVGLIAGLVLGVFVGVLFISPSGILPINGGTGTNNQVQVSGTVPDRTSGTIYFSNLDGTIQTSASITNGKYSVLLVSGQSYTASHISSVGHIIDGTFYPYIDYNEFYVPSGVTTFTEDLVPR